MDYSYREIDLIMARMMLRILTKVEQPVVVDWFKSDLNELLKYEDREI